MLDKILGNSTEIDHATAATALGGILLQGEIIESAYQPIRDMIVFTNKRLILLDKMGISGTKINVKSIPYKNILTFSIETAGTLDLDSELAIYILGTSPVIKNFKSGDLIYKIQAALVYHTC